MKRIFFLMMSLMGIVFANPAYADEFKDVKKAVSEGAASSSLVEGSLSVLAEKATAELVFEFPATRLASFRMKTKFEDLGPMMETLASLGVDNWPEIEKSVREFAANKFSKEKTFNLKIDDSNPKYEMKIVFENLCLGETDRTVTLRAFGAGGAAFSGNFIITETATGKVCLNLHVEYAYSVSSMGYHFTANKRLQCTIGDYFFGKYLPQLYKKNK